MIHVFKLAKCIMTSVSTKSHQQSFNSMNWKELGQATYITLIEPCQIGQ
jgi:hypothetical protein